MRDRRADANGSSPAPARARGFEASAREATLLVIRCLVQGVTVALLMSTLEPVARSVLEVLSRR